MLFIEIYGWKLYFANNSLCFSFWGLSFCFHYLCPLLASQYWWNVHSSNDLKENYKLKPWGVMDFVTTCALSAFHSYTRFRDSIVKTGVSYCWSVHSTVLSCRKWSLSGYVHVMQTYSDDYSWYMWLFEPLYLPW